MPENRHPIKMVINLPDRLIIPLSDGGTQEMSSDEYLDALEAQVEHLKKRKI